MNPVIAVATSRLGPVLGWVIGRFLPTETSNWLADQLAAWAAARSANHFVRAVRANQAVVRGLPFHDPSLTDVAFRVFKNAALGYLTFFRGLARGRRTLGNYCSVDPTLVANIRAAQAQGRGVFVVGPHMGNFDIGLVALQRYGFHPLVLTYRDPKGSYLADNAIRRSYGVELTPISLQSLRSSIRRLRAGGLVLTLVDRPDSRGEKVQFFGRTAQLPVGHVRLALRANAMIQVGVALKDGAGKYRIHAGPAIDPQRREGEGEAEASRRIAGRVIRAMEPFIRRRPEEWLMFQPVWPQAQQGADRAER